MSAKLHKYILNTDNIKVRKPKHTHTHTLRHSHAHSTEIYTNKHNRPTTAWSSERLKEFLSKSETIEQKEKKTTLDHMRIKKTQIVLSRKRTNKQEEGEQKKTKKKHKNHTHTTILLPINRNKNLIL